MDWKKEMILAMLSTQSACMKNDSWNECQMNQWEENAKVVEQIYGEFVDWEERFYLCPDCGKPVYECDWSTGALKKFLCPICEFREGE